MDGSVVEQLNDLSDVVCEARQERPGWLIDEPKGGFIERYLGGDMAIALRRRDAAGGWEPVQDGFIIQNFTAGHELKPIDLNAIRGNARVDSNQSFVFAAYIELMKDVKHRVPALVRPERFNNALFMLGKPLFAFNSISPEKVVGGTENWKVRFVARFYAIACGECRREQIEAAANRIDDSADLRIEDQIEWPLEHGGQYVVGRISITLHDKYIRAIPLPGSEALLERWDLGYGPIDSSLSI
jgi:hypothetical protein